MLSLPGVKSFFSILSNFLETTKQFRPIYLDGDVFEPAVVKLSRRGLGRSYSSMESVLRRPIAPSAALLAGTPE